MKIIVFINEISAGRMQMPTSHVELATIAHTVTGTPAGILIDDPTSMNDKSKQAIKMIMEFAIENNIKFKLYNIRDDWPAFLAWIGRIKIFPTVYIGRKKFDGLPVKEDLEVLLN